MTDLLERKTPAAVSPPVTKRGTELPPPPARPQRFLRWMGWMVGLVAIAAIVTWAILSGGGGPQLADIDRYDNPEVFLEVMPSTENPTGLVIVPPTARFIDPHESPEVIWLDR